MAASLFKTTIYLGSVLLVLFVLATIIPQEAEATMNVTNTWTPSQGGVKAIAVDPTRGNIEDDKEETSFFFRLLGFIIILNIIGVILYLAQSELLQIISTQVYSTR